MKKVFVLIISIVGVIPIQLDLQEGETIKENNIDNLNECLGVQRGVELGVCFGKEVLNKLNDYDEAESFSLANGVAFVRDEKTPRDIGSFLDKDPMDFRAIMEDASNLISKRSLHWDLGVVYPGLVMRIGPTLANGVLDFIIDPRIKDRAYHNHGEASTGRLLARNLLVPFLLGIKFHISTLLPLLLGLLLLASKKAFLLAKLALLAVTVFSGSGYGGGGYFGGSLGSTNFGPSLSSYTSHESPGHYHAHHSSGGYYRHPHHVEYYKEKSAEQTTGSPISPDELRDRLERLFVTKKDELDEGKIRNARNFAWTPINTG
ncbi:uncharacterized protein LOC126979787 [Leptidea sinapis]|uniref:uncharacterized protein LOC126979787 n=1 Tax=Leptidea sinapis TaxID=189913 RepID=UPI0021220C4B|nr:uncharacterized protein LOC126979787 [Leptidea sinapis]